MTSVAERPRRAGWRALLVFALLPLALFSYLGSQSRMMGDDFEHFLVGSELGPWESALHFRNTWNGSYSDYFVHGLLAPWQAVVPRAALAAYILIWMSGLAMLAACGLRLLQVKGQRALMSVVIAAFIVGATLHAVLTPQSVYYYAASIRYALTPALFTLYVALTLHLVTWADCRRRLAFAALAGATFAFVIAGFSEVFLVFQVAMLSLTLPAVYVIMRGAKRRRALALFSAGWLGTVMSLAVQMTAPGVAIRRARIQETVGVPVESIPVLALRSIGEALRIVYDPEIFAGVLLLFFLGLFTMLSADQRSERAAPPRAAQLKRNPLVLGLAAQLVFVPFVFSHTSDLAQALGRYSFGYSAVLAINIGMILGLVALILSRQGLNRQFSRYGLGWGVIIIPTLTLVIILFALTQFRSIHWRALTYLLVSCQMLLLLLIWQQTRDSELRKLFVILAAAYGALIIVNASGIFAQLFTKQKLIPRTLTLAPYGMILNGLLWGLICGSTLRQGTELQRWGSSCLAALKLISLVSIAGITALIIVRNAQLIAPFQTFARESDARHDYIMAERDGGARTIAVAPLSFDLEEYVGQVHPFHDQPFVPRYYGVDDIIVDDT